MSVRKLHNTLVSDPNDGGLKYSRDKDDNIIISDFTLHWMLPPELKQMSSQYKVMCCCECSIYEKLYIRHCYPGVIGIWKNLNIKANILKAEGLVKNHITYMKQINI